MTITNTKGESLKLDSLGQSDLVAALKAAHTAAKAKEAAALDALQGKHTEATYLHWADAADTTDDLDGLIEFITGKVVVK
mgnify:CR=1 FL=1